MLENPPLLPEWARFLEALNNLRTGATPENLELAAQAYVELPGREIKARGRAMIQDFIAGALTDDDAPAAQNYAAFLNYMKERGWKATFPPRKAENAAKYRDLVASLQMAFGIAATSIPPEIADMFDAEGKWLEELPSEVDDAIRYRDWLVSDPDTRGPEPKVTELDKRAARISLGRAPGAAGRPPVVKRVRG